MKQCYIESLDETFRRTTCILISKINSIISEYLAAGYRLTVRQLYYQLVARAIVENTERSYKRIISTVNDGRLAGLIDWDVIEDRTRAFSALARWESGKQRLEFAAHGFHMDMWEGQETRAFVIVEKEALAGVLERACHAYDVPLLAARGYPSATVLREFVIRDLEPAIMEGQRIQILHLGDHDPSGIDMTRDLRERITLFLSGCETDGNASDSFNLERIALNMDQVRALKPPPNPAKVTDSRFDAYRKKFGSESWELDALQPQFLSDLVQRNIKTYIDDDKWTARELQIASVTEKLKATARKFKE